jgi:hypothetical protein
MRFWKMKDFDKKNWICIEGFSFFFQNQQNKQPKESETRKFKQNRKAKKQGGKNEKTPQRHGITDAIY